MNRNSSIAPSVMEDSVKVRTMTPDDENRAIHTVVLGFVGDPMTRWVWPEAHQYLAAMPRFVRAFGGAAFAQGGAFCSDNTREPRYGFDPACITMKSVWLS